MPGLRHLRIDQAVLVGHDLGGGVVHIAAVRRPDLCGGLLITNGIGYDSWPIPSVKAMRAVSPLLSRLPALVLKPGLAALIGRGHDTFALGKEALGVHYGPTPGTAAAPRWHGRSAHLTSGTPSPFRMRCRASVSQPASGRCRSFPEG